MAASPAACGANGKACVDCGARADACVDGECLCGAGAACHGTSDTCSGGTCACGSGPACETGQLCVDGACVCSVGSCPSGCCSGGRCRIPSFVECGANGDACAACDALTADSCVDGQCACGAAAPCATGQECVAGACQCTTSSCPLGCCIAGRCVSGDDVQLCGSAALACERCGTGETCLDGVCSGCTAGTCPDGCCSGESCVPADVTACGSNGSACVPCAPDRADACVDGRCACGGGAACAPGQRCELGSCVCDAVSCAGGCCASGECVVASVAACGVFGGACQACDPARSDGCGAGQCRCGSTDQCPVGARCLDGACACDPTSCPDGCCDGLVCRLPTIYTCGRIGGRCQECNPSRSDGCAPDGNCLCGSSSQCRSGEACLGGRCTCTPETCDGCCDGDVCLPGNQQDACGAAGSSCETCPAGAPCNGGVCSGCNATTCPTGCCQGNSCHDPDAQHCGAGGSRCIRCDDQRADACSVDGQCTCGGGPECGPGQHCVFGLCICDDVSCPSGCCAGSVCRTRSLATCGIGGDTCQACDPDKANVCSSDGACACGNGAVCGAGQRCVSGTCLCDPDSCAGCCSGNVCLSGTFDGACGTGGAACQPCPSGQVCSDGACSGCNASICADGCCTGNTCNVASTLSCGAGGGACRSCNPATADRCEQGTCVCGSGAPCDAGQRCASGLCICDAASCPSGCCDVQQCVTSMSATACGSAGASCTSCDPELADNCAPDGECACGIGPACASGQACLNGACRCGPATCPSGCCDGDVCVVADVSKCGAAGIACAVCDPRTADRCLDGECACGAGAACRGGEQCVSGTCGCDAGCPTGCCIGDRCWSLEAVYCDAGHAERAASFFDASSDAPRETSNPFADVDGIRHATAVWPASFSPGRNAVLEFAGGLPAAATVSQVALQMSMLVNSPLDWACYHFEVRRASDDTIIASHGTPAMPAGCIAGASTASVRTALPEINAASVANALRIRLYVAHSAGDSVAIDAVRITGSAGVPFVLLPVRYEDWGTNEATRWTDPLAASGDGTSVTTSATWPPFFMPARYVDLRFAAPSSYPDGQVGDVEFVHAWRSASSLAAACLYLEVFDGSTLIASHGDALSPLSCTSGDALQLDNIALPEVDTPAELRALRLRIHIASTGLERTVHDHATVRATLGIVSDADRTPPVPLEVHTANGGTLAGRVEAGDVLGFAFTEAPSPPSILSGWDGLPAPVLVQIADAAGRDVLTIHDPVTGAPLNLGTLVVNNAVDSDTLFGTEANPSSIAVMGARVVLTFGELLVGTPRTDGATAPLSWFVPDAISDRAGNLTVASDAAEPGALDVEF